MRKKVSRTLKVSCSDSGAALKVSLNAAEITAGMKTHLEKQLRKKGVAVRWGEQGSNPELLIRVVEMDQGNQFLRYLLPFISPAVLEIEGEVALAGSSPQPDVSDTDGDGVRVSRNGRDGCLKQGTRTTFGGFRWTRRLARRTEAIETSSDLQRPGGILWSFQ